MFIPTFVPVGFKMTQQGSTDLEDILDEETDEKKHHDLIKESMLRLEDVVVEASLEKEDMFAWKKEMDDGGRVVIGKEQWMEVPSGSRLVGGYRG